MRLELILHKTEKKGNKNEYKRRPPSIAAEERPYDLHTVTPSKPKDKEESTMTLAETKNHIEIIF